MLLDPLLPDVLDGNVINGRKLATHVRTQAAEEVASLAADGHRLHLAVVMVGDNPASAVYVRNKIKACEKVGIQSLSLRLPATVTQKRLLTEVTRLNDDPEIDGVLVQLPLPPHIDEHAVVDAVDPEKDVDGFHPANLGLLLGRYALLQPCTPAGVMLMLQAIGTPLRGAQALVIGRSVIVGRPMTQLLIRSHATVTNCHRYTRELEEHVRRADVVVVATGVPDLVRGDWIKEGAVVIDVGINRQPDGSLCGDVEFEAARERAAAITPVPGGVGPMTISMLMWNTVLAARLRRGLGVRADGTPL